MSDSISPIPPFIPEIRKISAPDYLSETASNQSQTDFDVGYIEFNGKRYKVLVLNGFLPQSGGRCVHYHTILFAP